MDREKTKKKKKVSVILIRWIFDRQSLNTMGNAYFYSPVLTVYLPRKYWLM